MKLNPINPELRNGQYVKCIHCRIRITKGGYADEHGPPFIAYYCDDCAADLDGSK